MHFLIQNSPASPIFVSQGLGDGAGDEHLLGHERLFEWIRYVHLVYTAFTWSCRGQWAPAIALNRARYVISEGANSNARTFHVIIQM